MYATPGVAVVSVNLRLRVPGSLAPYVDSIRYLLKVPGAYEAEPTYPYRYSGLIDKLYEYTDLDGRSLWKETGGNVYIDTVISATNPTLLAYWIPHFGGYLSMAQCQRLGQLLDHPDSRIVHEVMRKLSIILNDPEGRPKTPTSYNNEFSYPGLEETRLFWKRRLGLIEIPPRQ